MNSRRQEEEIQRREIVSEKNPVSFSLSLRFSKCKSKTHTLLVSSSTTRSRSSLPVESRHFFGCLRLFLLLCSVSEKRRMKRHKTWVFYEKLREEKDMKARLSCLVIFLSVVTTLFGWLFRSFILPLHHHPLVSKKNKSETFCILSVFSCLMQTFMHHTHTHTHSFAGEIDTKVQKLQSMYIPDAVCSSLRFFSSLPFISRFSLIAALILSL